jgi:hypothetical protein
MTRFSNVAEVTKFRSVFEGICAQREYQRKLHAYFLHAWQKL